MAARVFFLSSARLVAHHWAGGRFTDEFVFPADEQGLTRFSEYLSTSAPEPVYLLVDVVEEEFREETIPHVMGSDRKAILRNKKTRLFRDSTYSHALVQGREASGRRDDQVLFTALIRPDLLAPWLGQVARLKVPLSGIYSLPLLSRALRKKLKIAGPNVLIVTLHSSGGLRQTFFQDQHLKLSRLAIAPDPRRAGHPSHIMAEIEKIRRYLGSLRLLGRDVPLDVYVISHGTLLEELQGQATDSITTRHHFLDTADTAKRIGLKTPPEGPYADRLFAHLLLKEPPQNHYAPDKERRYFSLQRTRSGMMAAGYLLVVGGLGVSGYKAVELVNTLQETKIVTDQTDFYADQLEKARQELPPAPALARDIQMAVEMADTLRSYKATPVPVMRVLSQGLERFPELKVDSIEWLSSPDPNTPIQGKGGDKALAAAIAQGLAADPAESGNQYHIAHMAGHVEPFDGDFRVALETVNRLVTVMSKLEGVQAVEPVVLPFDASSQRRLLGTASGDNNVEPANFVLRVVLLAHEAEETG